MATQTDRSLGESVLSSVGVGDGIIAILTGHRYLTEGRCGMNAVSDISCQLSSTFSIASFYILERHNLLEIYFNHSDLIFKIPLIIDRL